MRTIDTMNSMLHVALARIKELEERIDEKEAVIKFLEEQLKEI